MPASMVIPSPSLQPPSSDPAPLSGSPPLVTASSPSVSRGAATGKGQHEGGGGGGGGQKGRGQRDRNGRAGGIGQDIMGVAISVSEGVGWMCSKLRLLNLFFSIAAVRSGCGQQ